MHAGIDFGTSNCAVGVWPARARAPKLLPLEDGSPLLPSALYVSRAEVALEDLDGPELARRVAIARSQHGARQDKARAAKTAFKRLTDAEIEATERELLRREAVASARQRFEGQTLADSLAAGTEILLGRQAIARHVQDPESGHFVKSPKSFLGAEISAANLAVFETIVERMMASLKARAEANTTDGIDRIVLGRPVRFHGTTGEKGDAQATGILHRAATAAGFRHIEFMMEPVAAALDFERTVERDVVALVLDAGGGTTDCSVVRLGPSHAKLKDRSASVLGYSGDRVGGTDFDIALAMKKIMPQFGKDTLLVDGLPMPHLLYSNAIRINDVNAQATFLSPKTGREIENYLRQAQEKTKVARLLKMHEGRYMANVNRSAERAKIGLSDAEMVGIDVGYIDRELDIPVTRQDLREAVERELGVFLALMREAEAQAGVRPEIVYVTGGTAKSPVVEEWIRRHYAGAEVVVGDAFGSVAAGLATWAKRIYR